MQVIIQEDCGNAPRKMILRDLFVALVERDADVISDYVEEDVRYAEIGKMETRGIQGILEQLEVTVGHEVNLLELTHVITHGKTAAVNGKVVTADKKEIHFSTVVLFRSAGKQAKVKEMTSYIIVV